MAAASSSTSRPTSHKPPVTPDGRYFVVRGRLWRCSNPALEPHVREPLVRALMAARRAKGAALKAHDDAARECSRQAVDEAKHALGERGPVWWQDGAPDWNRHMARNTPYAEWFASLPTQPEPMNSTAKIRSSALL